MFAGRYQSECDRTNATRAALRPLRHSTHHKEWQDEDSANIKRTLGRREFSD
jgi:hypothetical protein